MGSEARVVVTGGSGFIGTNLVAELLERGASVASLDIKPPACREHASHWTEVDILDRAALRSAVERADPTHIVHLAARTDLRGADVSDYAANTEGTSNVLEASGTLGRTPRLLVASSRMVCKIGYQPRDDLDHCPPNAYGASKVETERIVRGSDHPEWAMFRPTSIWGPWFGIPYRDFFLSVARGRYRHPTGHEVRKSFGYVGNVVAQLLGLLEAEPQRVHGRVFYVADYEPIEVGDFARRIQAAVGAPPVRTVPVRLLRTVAPVGDVLQKLGWDDPPLTRFRLANLLTEMLHDLEPMRSIVPSLPCSLDEGIALTVAWLREADLLPTDAAA